jgi:branched-chain amino acid transport system permease protein
LVLLAVLVAAVAAAQLFGPSAGAQEPPTTATSTPDSTPATDVGATPGQEGGTSVRGTLIDRKGTGNSSDDTAVKDVRITVSTAGGEPVGSATTDDDGKFLIDVPSGEGAYTAHLDTSTLPKDVKLPESAATLNFQLTPGQSRVLLFDLNAAARATTGKFDAFLQALVDGTNFGLIIAMCSVGLSLIYGTTGLVNFAHGELVTAGALVAYFFNFDLGWTLIAAAIGGVIVVALGGWLLDAGFWGPLRRRGTGHIAQMVISIGLALALVNLYLYTFGGITRPYTDYHAQPAWEIGPIDLAPKKFASTIVSLIVLILVATALQRTRTGKAMRAISDNPDLAASSGINVDSVIRLVWLFGAGLAALGGILFSVSQDVNFEEGSSILLLLFAAITLGGLGAAYGALVGGFVVGLFVNVSTVWIPTELKNVGALVVLILVLLVRPQGILGRAERVG